MKLFVGNLSSAITEDVLRTEFSSFGQIESIAVVTDRFSGESKGFGFVEMVKNSDADKALKALNGKLILGRNIKVNQAQPKSKKQKRRRGY